MKTPSEIKDRIMELARNEGHIVGIYNYCDRWCERCAFTSKCLNYATSKDAPDSDGPELFEYLHNVFGATILMLDDMMKKLGIDPKGIKKMEPPEEKDPKDHPLYKKVHELSFTMHEWLKEYNPGTLPVELELENPEEVRNTRLHETIEVIYWYNFFISAKIFRALGGLDDEDYREDEIQNDSNGSAKVALISIDRLIGAWSVLMEHMKNNEDAILKFLIGLADVRKHTEAIFPNARKFIRPGFDQ